jgi:ADP-heptose:LPS heptosyltransferase
MALALQGLDLVVTVDTAVAHVAGALGRPVILLLALIHDWRWVFGRSDSPWYPTLRILRQKAPGRWESVVRDLQHHLHLATGFP